MKEYFVTIHYTSKTLNWLSKNFVIKAKDAETAFAKAEARVKKLKSFRSISGGDCSLTFKATNNQTIVDVAEEYFSNLRKTLEAEETKELDAHRAGT